MAGSDAASGGPSRWWQHVINVDTPLLRSLPQAVLERVLGAARERRTAPGEEAARRGAQAPRDAAVAGMIGRAR